VSGIYSASWRVDGTTDLDPWRAGDPIDLRPGVFTWDGLPDRPCDGVARVLAVMVSTSTASPSLPRFQWGWIRRTGTWDPAASPPSEGATVVDRLLPSGAIRRRSYYDDNDGRGWAVPYVQRADPLLFWARLLKGGNSYDAVVTMTWRWDVVPAA